jgi:DNA segregation ATPase FtsK/SpoIIIE, S-DNA-T family
MAKRAQSSDTSTRKKPTKKETKNRYSLGTDGRIRNIVGIVFIFIAIFLAVSLSSYLVTWQYDQDKVFQTRSGLRFLMADQPDILNAGGRLGAWVSHQLIFKGFGIASFLFILLFALWGSNLLFPRRLYSSLKATFYAVLWILLLSPLLAWIFPSQTNPFSYGGALGELCLHHILAFAGKVGTLSIMLGILLILSMFILYPLWNLPVWQRLFSTPDSSVEPQPIPIKSSKKAKLSIDESAIPSPVEEMVTADTTAPEDTTIAAEIPESFWEPEPEPAVFTREIELAIEPSAPEEARSNPLPAEDLPLEVVHHEDSAQVISDAHRSIGTDEPYDPSLELRNYKFPTIDLLDQHDTDDISIDKNELEQNKNQIINTLKSFGIAISKISATVGPTVTLYEIVPAEGVRISKIRNLEDDIALSLSALGIRIIAPIPGKGTIGIEVPNLKKQIVSMRTLISSEKFINTTFSLPIVLGKKIDNENFIVDLATMPHLLMAGATGQGKSVGINAILVSLLYKKHPSQVKFVMVDPKKVELSIYKTIEKHFLAKLPNEEEAIITDTKKVINTLNALCIEMDNRYDLLKEAGVRNIKEYNEKFIKRRLNPNKGHQYLPFIVLVVDEFADLIMTAGKEVEMPIARLAQLARAVGIHLIIATQRPSVNVITGTIKANFPGRIAFRVSAKVDSRTILDTGGADQLVGRGDMLILHGSDLVRVQCAFVDTPEVERIVNFIGNQQGYPTAFDLPEYEGADGGDLAGGAGSKSLKDVDQMFEQCARLVVTSGSGSTSMLQRRFNLGYNRAGRIMDQLEAAGIVGGSTGGKPRELLVHTEAELEEILAHISR